MRFPILLLLFLSGTFSTSQTSQPQSRPEKQSPPASRPIPSSTADVKETLDSTHQKLEHGDPQGAIAMLQQLAAAGKSSAPGVQHELGIAYYRTGKLISAEKAFAQAMTEDPNDMESVQMRGLSLYRLGRPADAIPYLERVKQWTPNANADASYVLGLCYLNSQRFDNARISFANQFDVPPDSGAAYLLLGKMLMQANLPEKAAQAAQRAVELTPNIALAHFMLGEFYLFKSDTAQALREFEQERKINPANAAVYDRLGDLYTRTGQFQQAQESLAKAISLDTSSTGPFIQMGKVLLRRNDPQTSLLYLQHAEKMDPGNYITHTLLGQAYRSLGREQDAKNEMETAAKIHAESELKLQPVQ
ncbi:MAG TPA: tetratricopeptide repeat protein [Terriglobales bacterium]|jgi:tetratricopeptide (TPR) repeat protein|nr:tetratricopeptide repeat protein [Terriglobales bacterium]